MLFLLLDLILCKFYFDKKNYVNIKICNIFLFKILEIDLCIFIMYLVLEIIFVNKNKVFIYC